MASSINRNSDAWAGAWGLSWAGAWGWSWSPIHEVEEEPHNYYGNGQRKPYSDLSEDEVIQLVHEKWEAIEAASKQDRQSKQVESGRQTSLPVIDSPQTPKEFVRVEQHIPTVTNPKILAQHWPDLFIPSLPSIEASVSTDMQYQAEFDRKERTSEALLLVLAAEV